MEDIYFKYMVDFGSREKKINWVNTVLYNFSLYSWCLLEVIARIVFVWPIKNLFYLSSSGILKKK